MGSRYCLVGGVGWAGWWRYGWRERVGGATVVEDAAAPGRRRTVRWVGGEREHRCRARLTARDYNARESKAMNCAACNHENRPAAKFCTGCGGELTAAAKFSACGGSLRQVAVGDAAELAQLLLVLGHLDAQLIERELELASLTAELRAFETRYLSIVGVKLAELDRLRADLAARRAREQPSNESANVEAERARAQARRSEEAAGRVAGAPESSYRFEPSDGLKRLYRELAKLVHPDYATDEADRARRTPFMQRANEAYQSEDEAALARIMLEWQSGATAVTEQLSTEGALVKVKANIEHRTTRLAEIEGELTTLRESDLQKLMEQVEAAEAQGHDPLADLRLVTELDIENLRKEMAAT